ncbi:MAG: hypothetical protein F6K31_39905 [Symploca sp. SIO2G7]|nr:hypothetical protein [Symploca sp. SIO2G7]
MPMLCSIVGFVFISSGMLVTTALAIMMDKSRPEMAGTDYTLQTSLASHRNQNRRFGL